MRQEGSSGRGFRKESGSRDNRGFRNDSGSQGNRGFRDFGPREMHKATCSECGNECEVPFKPTEGKPVYCRECYRNKKRF
ncbi:MAG: CxxC-x17-CxxC domain-containing protein [Nanoarchaeota archaeon]